MEMLLSCGTSRSSITLPSVPRVNEKVIFGGTTYVVYDVVYEVNYSQVLVLVNEQE